MWTWVAAILMAAGPVTVDGGEAKAPIPIPRKVTALRVKGYLDASHVGPADASIPPPLVVVLHGNYDRPEWECDLWSRILDGKAWVLCTRGVRREGTTIGEDRWTYPTFVYAKAELAAAIAVLRERHGGAIAEGVYLLAGMSLGSALARDMALEDPSRYPRLVLVEGGNSGWTEPAVEGFAERGGEQVVFACGQKGCADRARSVVAALEKVGTKARLVYDPSAGHNYSESMARRLKGACAIGP